MILSDNDIDELIIQHLEAKGGYHQFAHLVEAAVIARLATVSVEPVGEVSGNAWDEGILYRDCEPGEPLHTATQLAAALVQAIEEAAKIALENGDGATWEAIRALIGAGG